MVGMKAVTEDQQRRFDLFIGDMGKILQRSKYDFNYQEMQSAVVMTLLATICAQLESSKDTHPSLTLGAKLDQARNFVDHISEVLKFKLEEKYLK